MLGYLTQPQKSVKTVVEIYYIRLDFFFYYSFIPVAGACLSSLNSFS